jgi:hypothetical protein
MKTKIALVVAFVVLLLLGYLNPQSLYSPGNLHERHSKIKDCSKCHEPFKSPEGATCIAFECHDFFYWTKKKQVFIGHLEKTGCDQCHTEHKGEREVISNLEPHKGVSETSYCRTCHRTTSYHAEVKTQDCKRCHSMERYRPAKHDYCYSCHDHSYGKVEAAHQKKGIINYSNTPNCVQCHPTDKEHEQKKVIIIEGENER